MTLCLSACSGNTNKLAGRANINESTSESDEESFEEPNNTAERRAELLAGKVKELPEIEHASVVISGNTAMIGIVVKGDIKDTELIALKNRIREKVSSADSEINHVAVSAAPELYEKLTRLNNGGAEQKEEDRLHRNIDENKVFRLVPTLMID